MAQPNSRRSLADYAKRALGAPVTEINVDDDQVGDRLDEAIQFYQEYHSDGITKVFRIHQITQADIDAKCLDLSDEPQMLSVTRILPFGAIAGGDFRPEYQLFMNSVNGLSQSGNLIGYYMMQSHLSFISTMFDGQNEMIDFNPHTDILQIFAGWGTELVLGQTLILEGYEPANPGSHSKIYNDMFLKRYFTSLLKLQWGTNLKKFEGMQLPGGVTINGQSIYDEAKEEISLAEETMQLRFEEPPGIFIG